MDETDKKIRELTEAMRAEQDARIRNRMMAVRGILAGYPTKDAAYFADVDRRTVQLWVARFDEGGIGGLRDAPGRGRPPRAGYGRIRKLADRLAGKNMLTPRKLRNWIRGKLNARYSLCSVRRILRFLGFSSKRSTTGVRLGSRLRCGKAVAGRRRRHDIVGKKAWIRSRGAGRVHIHQDWDKRKETAVARRGTRGRNQARQEGQDHRVRHACRGRNPADAAVWKVRRPDVRTIPQGGAPQVGKVLLVTDNAGQHKHREVRKYLEEHDGLEILYLPTATPKLSAVESVWKDAKYRLVTSEHYETLEDLTHAASEYFRMCSIRLDIHRFLYRCV